MRISFGPINYPRAAEHLNSARSIVCNEKGKTCCSSAQVGGGTAAPAANTQVMVQIQQLSKRSIASEHLYSGSVRILRAARINTGQPSLTHTTNEHKLGGQRAKHRITDDLVAAAHARASTRADVRVTVTRSIFFNCCQPSHQVATSGSTIDVATTRDRSMH